MITRSPDPAPRSSPKDALIAERLSRMLQRNGLTVFRDRDLLASASLKNTVRETLGQANAVVVLLSRNSTTNKFIEEEVRIALQEGRPVIPVFLDDDATNNWVWPLISDRQAIRIDSDKGVDEVAREVKRVVQVNDTRAGEVSDSTSRGARRWWLTLLVAAVSAVAGALITWLVS
jgi:TIR domain